MALIRNQLIVAELDQMAAKLESEGNTELASLIDEVAADLLTEPAATTTAAAPKKAPKPAKSNGKRRKKNKKKTAAPKVVVSRADAKKILKAAHAELLDIAGELIKDGNLKEARNIIKYAEEVKDEEDKLEAPVDLIPSPEVPSDEGMDDEDAPGEEDEDMPSSEDDDLDDGDEDADDGDDDDMDDEDDDMDDDVEAMIRKYELGDDSPKAPAATPAPSAPAADKPKADDKAEKCDDKPADKPKSAPKAEPKADEKEDDKDEDKNDDKDEDDKDEDKDEKPEEKEAKAKLFTLAKKLAAAGESKLAFEIADLLDRK